MLDVAAPGTPTEQCLVDVAALPSASADDLPPAERARRERMREVTSGITAFSLDEEGSRIAFAVSGTPYLVDLRGPDPYVQALPSPGPVVDPRIDPSGSRVAVVVDRSLMVIEVASGRVASYCPSSGEHESWGLADFIAAEELDRYRGHWWIDDGEALLVEQVDESGVEVRWIGDPTLPEQEPVAHRYPSAGTPNAAVALYRVELDGSRRQLDWGQDAYPYLASVHATGSGVTIQVLSRDQRSGRTLALNPGEDHLELLHEVDDPHWLDVMPGVPVRDDGGALVDILVDRETDTYRLWRDGNWLSPPGLQVRGLLEATGQSVAFLASTDPTTQGLYQIDLATGGLRALAEGGWCSGLVKAGVSVLAESDAEGVQTRFSAGMAVRHPMHSHAEVPAIEVAPILRRCGQRQLATALILPRGHQPGSRLPVIMSPYGGPHAQRVVQSGLSYGSDQWIADQGFAVVIVDGRGTPGRGPAFERAIFGDLAGTVLQDQVDGLQALSGEFDDLDLDRVGIRGWSFGGYLAALAVLDRPDVFHAAVAGAPVTDWLLYDTAYTERYLGNPTLDPEAYERVSLIPRAPALSRPLLMLHGLADDNVLAAHTLQLSGALLASGRPHAVVPLSGVTHMTPQEVVAENLLRLEVEFFRTHLRPLP